MQRDRTEDMSSLARLAQQPDADLRPVLLRVQAQDFAAASRRDPERIAAFETLVLGLLPLVTDDVLAGLRSILRDVPDTPPSVLAALAGRLDRGDRTAGGARAISAAAFVGYGSRTKGSNDRPARSSIAIHQRS